MTEVEWQTCTDPLEMLVFLEKRASNRKLQLFAVACCRWCAWNLITDSLYREAVKAAERFADGFLSEATFDKVLRPVVKLWAKIPGRSKTKWGPFHYMTAATRHLTGGGSSRDAASFVARGMACQVGEEGSPPWHAAACRKDHTVCAAPRHLRIPIPPLLFQIDLAFQNRAPPLWHWRERSRMKASSPTSRRWQWAPSKQAATITPSFITAARRIIMFTVAGFSMPCLDEKMRFMRD